MASAIETKKRKANSPIVNREKESRCEPNMESKAESENVNANEASAATFRLSLLQTLRRSSTTSKESYSTVTSKTTQRTEKRVRESVFTTSKPEGAFRDEIVVELQTLDDQVFKGQVTLKEAKNSIFQEILGFKRADLSGMMMTYSGGPIITYKLYSQFNIDQLASVQFFELERKMTVRGEEKTSILKCKIRGIRTEQRVEGEPYEDTGLRWVKIEGCGYRVEKDQMIEWLTNFGEIKSEVTEDTYEESDDSENDMPVGNSIYSVRMKILRDMPQFVPMYGKRVRLYYRGIVKRCTNCFQPHQRKFCKNEKVTWPDYVDGFARMFPEIPQIMYGKWKALIKTTVSMSSPENKPLKEQETLSEEKEIGVQTKEKKKQTKTQRSEQSGSQDCGKQGAGAEEDESNFEDEETEEQALEKLVKKMLASGISAKSMQRTIERESKEGKAKTKQQALGKGRGKGSGRGKK